MAIVLLDRSAANGSAIGKVVSVHLAHDLAQRASEEYKRFCYSVGLRPALSIVSTKLDAFGAGDLISLADLVDNEPDRKPAKPVYVRPPSNEGQDFGRSPL